MNKKIFYINRLSGEKKEEKVYFEKTLFFLYSSTLGKFICKLLATAPLFSKLFGWWQSLPITKHKIAPFVKKYHVDAREFEKPLEAFESFNAFFIRKLKKETRPLSSKAVIPADGRYLVYPDLELCEGIVVKGKKFSLTKLLKSEELAKKYAQGSLLIARLCPSDYHRFHFPFDCTPSRALLIKGPLYSVNPIALRHNLDFLTENKRMLTQLSTKEYGEVLYIEVGATNVGSIHQTYIPNQPCKKGDEKGFFSFGGSSILMLFESSKIEFAEDLVSNSSHYLETLCHFGQNLEKV